jgi:CheY-like chemotaxis protein
MPTTDTTARFEAELLEMEKTLGMDVDTPPPDDRPPVMIVDDDPIYLSALRDNLSRDYSVMACKNGYEALERIDPTFDSIVLDIKMAGLSGLDVADKLNSRHIAVPIIFNTGYPGDYVRSDIEKRYAPFGYVTKDDPYSLISCLRKATNSATSTHY